MDVFFAGRKSESALKKAVKAAGHKVLRTKHPGMDAVVWTDAYGRDTAIKALEADIPVYYAGTLDALNRKSGELDRNLTSNTLLYVPYTRLVSAPFSAMTVQVAEGAVGDPGFIRVHSNQPFPKPTVPPAKRSQYRVLWGSLIHDIDWLHREFGPVKKIFCQGVQKARPKLEYVMATFTMKSGLIAQVIHSYQSFGESIVRAEISGTTGIVQFDSADTPIRQHGGSGSIANDDASIAAQWNLFESLADKRRISKKVQKSFIDPVTIAALAEESIRTGSPQKR